MEKTGRGLTLPVVAPPWSQHHRPLRAAPARAGSRDCRHRKKCASACSIFSGGRSFRAQPRLSSSTVSRRSRPGRLTQRSRGTVSRTGRRHRATRRSASGGADVDGGRHADAVIEELEDVLAALAWRLRARWCAPARRRCSLLERARDRVEVHLLEHHASVNGPASAAPPRAPISARAVGALVRLDEPTTTSTPSARTCAS